MSVILLLCLIPTKPFEADLGFFELDKLVHIFFFIAITLINNRGIANYLIAEGLVAKFATHYAVLVSVLFGLLIEFLQETLPTGRQYEAYDVLANCVGTFLAFLIVKGIRPRLG